MLEPVDVDIAQQQQPLDAARDGVKLTTHKVTIMNFFYNRNLELGKSDLHLFQPMQELIPNVVIKPKVGKHHSHRCSWTKTKNSVIPQQKKKQTPIMRWTNQPV